MSAHDFEKNVQEQMTEFNITPSDSAWNNVELQLKKDKRRRRIIIWLPLFLLLGLGGYFLYNHSSSSDTITENLPKQNSAISENEKLTENTEKPNAKEQPDVNNKPNSSLAEENEIAASDTKIDKAQINKKSQENNSLKEPGSQEQIVVQKQIKQSNESVKTVNRIESSRKTKAAIKRNPELSGSFAKQRTETANDNKLLQEDVEKKFIASAIRDGQFLTVGHAMPLSFNLVPFTTTSLVASAAPFKPVPGIKNKPSNTPTKWQWGANLGWGVSRISEGNFFSGLTAARVADANYSSSVSSPPPSGPFNSQPASIHAGSSWQAGVFTERKLSPKVGVSAGLQYGHYSTRSTIGIAVDSQKTISNSSSQSLAVDNYYTSGTGTNYKSRYHFFELPLNLNIQLNKVNRMPLVWSVGFTYSYLLSTSALQYDGVSGVYYEDDKLFGKSQWYWQTGLSVGLLSKSKHPIYIGPRLQYNTTSLLKNTAPGNNHLWGGSLQLKWLLKK